MSEQLLYKISTRQAWDEARRTGTLPYNADDERDGYIHLSAAHQVRQTLCRHFAGQTGLVMLAVDPGRLPPGAIRWEASRAGENFPHLYAPLPIDAVISADPVDGVADTGH